MTESKRAVSLLLALSLLSFAAACGEEQADDEPADSMRVEIQAFDFYFDPETITLELGSEVTLDLINNGDNQHSFTSSDLDVEVQASGGETVSATFQAPGEPGSYEFFCQFHPEEMTGTVSVGGDPDEVPAGEDTDPEDDDQDNESDVNVDTDTDTDTDADDDY